MSRSARIHRTLHELPLSFSSTPPHRFALRRLFICAAVIAVAAAFFVSHSYASAAPAAAATSQYPTGIYQVWGRDADAQRLPYVVGGQIMVNWDKLEPGRNQFAPSVWASIDSRIASYVAAGKPVTVQVNSSGRKPSWVWNVVANCTVTGDHWDYPQFWDPRYLVLQTEMITALANHLASLPANLKANVLLVRASPNAYGTESTDPPPGDPSVPDNSSCRPTPDGHIDSRPWSLSLMENYYEGVMRAYYDAIIPAGIHVALRAKLFTFTHYNVPFDLIDTRLGGQGWIFGTGTLADPRGSAQGQDQLAINYARPGYTTAYWEPGQHTPFANAVSWNYWRLLLELNKGVSYIAVFGKDLLLGETNPEYRDAFDFVNTYAGNATDPASSPGAWCALRPNPNLGITGDYCRFMQQLTPDQTSVGLDSNSGTQMIGPSDQRFGRYARRTDVASGKTTMMFQLDPAFRSSLTGLTCALNVTYLDQGTGSFAVTWGTGADTQQVAKTNSGRWMQTSIDTPCSEFQGALDSGSDVMLSALGAEDTTFHMVEVRVTR